MTQESRVFEANFVQHIRLDYLLHLPGGYEASPDRTWPLILFLHGAGERGSDLNLVMKHGIAKVAGERADFPFITVSPQCPENTWWADHRQALTALLDHVAGAYRVDLDRVYLTGLSMGGYGTWTLAASEPQRFAARSSIIALWIRFGRVLPLAGLAQVALAGRVIETGFHLAFAALTAGTVHHRLILRASPCCLPLSLC